MKRVWSIFWGGNFLGLTPMRNHDRVSLGYIDVVYVTGESSALIKIISRVHDVTFADDECRLFLETFAGIYDVIVTGGELNNDSSLTQFLADTNHYHIIYSR